MAQIRPAATEMFHTQTKKSQRQKQNRTQFTACGKNNAHVMLCEQVKQNVSISPQRQICTCGPQSSP